VRVGLRYLGVADDPFLGQKPRTADASGSISRTRAASIISRPGTLFAAAPEQLVQAGSLRS
jgi:hypothetical protein